MNGKLYFSVAGSILLSTLLQAEEAIRLEDYTVTATQNPELKLTEAPVPVSVVSSEEIEQKGITTVQELFKHTSGVDAKTAGGSVMPVIRGLSDEQVLILVDGVRLSDERPGGNHILSIDPAQIDRMEIVKGPGSVLYGAGAIGGVVNIITKKAPKGETEEFAISGEVGAGYETNNNAKMGKAQINASSKDLNLYIGGVKRKSDDIESPDEEVKFSFYDGYTIWGGGDYTSGNWNTAINLWQTKADIGITAPRGFVADYYKDEKHTMANAKVSYQSDSGLLRQFDLLAGWQEHNRNRIREPDADKLVDIQVDKDTSTLRGQWILVPNEANRVTTGFDLFDEDLTSSRIMDGFPPPIGKFSGVPVIAPSTRKGIGIFIQDEVEFNELWSMTAGARYDSIETKTDGAPPPFFINTPQSDTDSAFSGELGVVYKINEKSNIYANIGRAFRAPTLIERYFFGPHDGPAQDRGNPDLDPETSLNTDIGLRLGTDRYKASVSLYYNKVDNLIRKILTNPNDPVPEQIYQYQNISKAKLYGGELDLNYFIDDAWSLFLSGSLMRGEDENDDRPLNAIPPVKARYGINYEVYWRNMDINLELSATSAMRQDNVGIGERETPGYTTADFRAYFALDNGVNLLLSLDNMFDKTYYDHLSYGWQQLGYASMGRNVKFDLNYKF
ncbi:MAG: TonB-dependent receptor [Campylobacterota bacterium]|nr:TonB-dependent receptor [Campylobacterota bacterium]